MVLTFMTEAIWTTFLVNPLNLLHCQRSDFSSCLQVRQVEKYFLLQASENRLMDILWVVCGCKYCDLQFIGIMNLHPVADLGMSLWIGAQALSP